jgi:predicted HD phosphohydrolase
LVSEFEWDLHTSIETSQTLSQAVDEKSAIYDALSDTVVAFDRTFGAEDIPSSSTSCSHMLALSGHMWSKLCEALHMGVKRALAFVASHYETDLERVSEGDILLEGDDLAEVEA